MQPDGPPSVFVQQLEARRLRAGQSQAAAAAALGCSPSVWSRAVRGLQPVTLDFARRVIAVWPEFAYYYAADLAAAAQLPSGRKEQDGTTCRVHAETA